MIDTSSLANQLIFTTVRIEGNDGEGKSTFGTGFFLSFNIGHEKKIPLIVTNKHVIRGMKKGCFVFSEGIEKEGKLDPTFKSFPINIENFEDMWVFHPEDDIDLCCVPLGYFIQAAKNLGKSIFFKFLGEELIFSDSKLEELSAVEEILMVGYPNGLWDKVNNLPIIRKGITAFHPGIDFEGKSQGVIDAACFPGSSGSPILVVNQGSYSKGSGIVMGSRVIFLGVLFGGPIMDSEGEIKIEAIPTKTRVKVTTPSMIHLGFYVKSRELLFFKEHFEQINQNNVQNSSTSTG